MFFVGYDDYVMCIGVLYGMQDGGCVVFDLGGGMWVVYVVGDFVEDVLWIFVVWVVGGQYNVWCQVFGDSVYLWMFVGVVVVVVVEYGLQFFVVCFGNWCECVQCLFQCVWCVGVIYYY